MFNICNCASFAQLLLILDYTLIKDYPLLYFFFITLFIYKDVPYYLIIILFSYILHVCPFSNCFFILYYLLYSIYNIATLIISSSLMLVLDPKIGVILCLLSYLSVVCSLILIFHLYYINFLRASNYMLCFMHILNLVVKSIIH